MILKKEKADIFLLLLLFILNGNNVIYNLFYILPTAVINLFYLCLVLLFSILFRVNIYLNKRFIILFIMFLILLITQSFLLNDRPIIGKVVRYFFNFSIGYLIFSFIDRGSLSFLKNIIKFIVISSLVVWIPTSILLDIFNINVLNFIPSVLRWQGSANSLDYSHILIYNFRNIDNNIYFWFRNSSFYWEPGAFAGTLLMVYLIAILYRNVFSVKNFKELEFWIIIGVLSSLSTSGLLILPFIFLYSRFQSKNRINEYLKYFLFIVPTLALLIYFAFNFLPVLGDKILSQLDLVSLEKSGSDSTRLGSLLFLWNLILDQPFIGYGLFVDSSNWYDLLESLYFNSDHEIGNGFGLLLAQCGVIFSFFFFYLIFININSFYKSYFSSFFILIVLLLILQSQAWFNYPVIYLFAYLNFNKR